MRTGDISSPAAALATSRFVAGQVYREHRPENVERIEKRIRNAYRGTNSNRIPVPQRLFLRVLAVMDQHVVVISTEDPHATVDFVAIEQASHFVDRGDWILSDIEPLQVLRLTDENLSEKQRARMHKNARLIKALIELDTRALIAKVRWPVVKAIARDHGVAIRQILRVFRRYLQGGMSVQVLAGRWFRRVKGIGLGSRVAMAVATDSPRKAAGRPRLDGRRPYVVREADIHKIIRGSRKYFFSGESAGNWTLAWKLTVADIFLNLDCSRGIPPDEQLSGLIGTYPTYTQFRYWAARDDQFEMLLRKLYGDKKFNLSLRRRRHKTESKAAGPGAIFQIDATPLDWHLVHQLTRLPLEKKAQLYLVIDAFSHLIVGFYLHLGDEKYDAVSLALLAAADDKVALCANYDVQITANEWVAACLPTRLAADGAAANYKHGVLVEKGVIRGLTIAPPYRADLKGLVEAYNSAIKKRAESIPGSTSTRKERGEIDPAAFACLDYFETVKLIISWILKTNRRTDHDYQLTPEMIADQVIPCPRDIWDWGCANLSGQRKVWPKEALMRWCLPTSKALMTRDGVAFGEMLYEPIPGSLPQFDDWCAHAAHNGSWNVTVSHHPSKYSEFYLHEGEDLVKMQLTPRSKTYATWSAADYEGYKATTAVALKVRESEYEIYSVASEREQQQIIHGAKLKTEAARGTVAERRRDKSDRKNSLAHQKRLIAARGIFPASVISETAVDALSAEDEAEVVNFMEMPRDDET
jgi:putative transposase